MFSRFAQWPFEVGQLRSRVIHLSRVPPAMPAVSDVCALGLR